MSMAAYNASTTPRECRDLAVTPWDVFHRIESLLGFRFVHDVCATAESAKCVSYYDDHALDVPWSSDFTYLSTLWMNPPYSKPYPWVEKANNESKFNVIVVGLLPVNTSVSWFADHINGQANTIYFPTKRIKFERPDGTVMDRPFQSSMIVVWTPWRTGHTQMAACEL